VDIVLSLLALPLSYHWPAWHSSSAVLFERVETGEQIVCLRRLGALPNRLPTTMQRCVDT